MEIRSCYGMSIDGLNTQHMHMINGNESVEMFKNVNGIMYKKEKFPSFEEHKNFPLTVKNLAVKAPLSKISFIELPMADPEMILKFSGTGVYNGRKPTIEVIQHETEIWVKERYSGTTFSGKLRLDIVVPKGFMYGNVAVKTTMGDIQGYLRARSMKIDTLNGNIQMRLDGKNLSIDTLTGDIEIRFKAKAQSVFNLDTVSGDVDLAIDNVSEVHVNGKKTNVSDGKYPLDISYSNLNGKLKIR